MEFIFFTGTIAVFLLTIYYAINKKSKKSKVNTSLNNQVVDQYPLIRQDDIGYSIQPVPITNFKTVDLQLDNPTKHLLKNTFKNTREAQKIINGRKNYVLEFSKDVSNKLASGDYKIMKTAGKDGSLRTIAVDSKHKIRGHAMLRKQGLNVQQVKGLMMNIATQAVAQEHLQRIDEKLAAIDSKVDRILFEVEERDKSNYKGNYNYLKSITKEVLDNNTRADSSYTNQIELIVRENYQAFEHIISRIDFLLKDIDEMEINNYVYIKNPEKEVQQFANRAENTLFVAYGQLELLIICLSLKMAINSESIANYNRYEQLNVYVNQLSEKENHLKVKLGNKINEYNVGLHVNIIGGSKKIEKKKDELLKYFTSMNTYIIENKNNIEQMKVSLNPKEIANKPIRLLISEDDGIRTVSKIV